MLVRFGLNHVPVGVICSEKIMKNCLDFGHSVAICTVRVLLVKYYYYYYYLMLLDRSFFTMTLLFASLQDALDTGECSKIRILMRFLTVLVCEVSVSLFSIKL